MRPTPILPDFWASGTGGALRQTTGPAGSAARCRGRVDGESRSWSTQNGSLTCAAGDLGSREKPAHVRDSSDFMERALAGYERSRDLPGTDGTSGLSPHLHFGEIGPRQVWHAVKGGRRAKERSACEWGCRRVRHSGGGILAATRLAGVRPLSALSLPAYHGRTLPSRVRPLSLGRRSRCARGLEAGRDRVSARGRGDEAVVGRRVDAQSRAHGGRFVPDQGSADPVAARGGLVLGPPRRRRPGQQHARVAVDGRLGSRCGAVLPSLQPHAAGAALRSRTAPTWRGGSPRRAPPKGRERMSSPWSTTGRPARGRSPHFGDWPATDLLGSCAAYASMRRSTHHRMRTGEKGDCCTDRPLLRCDPLLKCHPRGEQATRLAMSAFRRRQDLLQVQRDDKGRGDGRRSEGGSSA